MAPTKARMQAGKLEKFLTYKAQIKSKENIEKLFLNEMKAC